MHYLLTKADQKVFELAFKAVLPRISIIGEKSKVAQCIGYLISQKWLSFSDAEWKTMEMLNSEVYDLLHTDV